MRKPFVARSAVLLLAVLACQSRELMGPGDALPEASVASVSVELTATNIPIGQRTQAIARAFDAAGNVIPGKVTHWRAEFPAVATVSNDGSITAVAAGSTQIVAVIDGVTGHHPLTVAVPPGSDPSGVATLTVSAPSTSLTIGQSLQLTATARDASARPVSVSISWSVDMPSIASVSPTGVVTAVGPGTVIITASAGVAVAGASISVASSGAGSAPGPAPPSALLPSPAELPRAFVSTAMPGVTGRTITIASGGNLQAALDQAQPGDQLLLASGATYVGNFVLPKKSGDGWIVIRTDAALPAEGMRITPAQAGALAKIVSPTASPAIQTAAGARRYRLIGLEVTTTAQSEQYGLVSLGGAETPEYIVLDRMYVHGSATGNTMRCVALNSAWSAIIDSYLSDCHHQSSDAQAIAGWNGPGPFKIVNNYLEGSAENILFGGADPSVSGLIPSDIEIRRNHITRPTSWKGVWGVKNLLELKNAQRVLIEGNVFENNWQHWQDGEAILFVGVNQSGSAPWSAVRDITFRMNVLRNVGAGFLVTTYTQNGPVQPTERISIQNNLIHSLNTGLFAGTGRTFTVTGDVRDFRAEHNTVVEPTNSILSLDGGSKARLVMFNNLGAGGAYGIAGTGAVGAKAFAQHAADGQFAGNVLAMPIRADEMPQGSGNAYPQSVANLQLQGDYRLAASSPYRGIASGGKDPGADISAVVSATLGVVTP